MRNMRLPIMSKLAFAGLFCLSFLNLSGYSADNQPPNILIIIADDATYNDLPLYGGENVKTPHIDQLAGEGLTFNKAFLSMSMCVPCRAALYTGLHPVRNGVCWNHAPARSGLRSIVQFLGELGYRTGIAGKVHATPREVFPFEMVEGIERNCVSETATYDDKEIGKFFNRDPGASIDTKAAWEAARNNEHFGIQLQSP
jgi:uncharacterized sulfatase